MFGKLFQFLSKDREPVATPKKSSAVNRPETIFNGTAQSPEKLCGITAGMSQEEIRAQLATLYKRYNRAASSLDESLRAESEVMLDAIVGVREKHFGAI